MISILKIRLANLNAFLNWYVNPEMPEEAIKDFIAINDIEKQKHLLAELLDKNQLYVNLSEIEDADFEVSAEDRALNKLMKWKGIFTILITFYMPLQKPILNN